MDTHRNKQDDGWTITTSGNDDKQEIVKGTGMVGLIAMTTVLLAKYEKEKETRAQENH